MNLRANQGQSCGSTSRLFIHDDLYDDVIAALQAQLESLTLGVAYDPDTDMGPMISQAHADRVRSMIAEAVDSGANLISGGLQDPRAQAGEYFVAPTLFGSVDHHSALAQREIFGLVISAFRWNDVDDAINRINDVAYGLTASIWTNDLSSAIDAADRIAVGYVWVNDSTTHYWGMPFGGWDESGIGKEESMEEYLSFLRLKSVHLTYRNE